MPLLETLAIDTADSDPQDILLQFITLQNASSIRHLKLDMGPDCTKISIIPFVWWKQLTHLNIESYITTGTLASVLWQYMALQDAQFCICLDSEAGVSVNPYKAPILPHLSILKLNLLYLLADQLTSINHTWDVFSTVFSKIQLPALRSVTCGTGDLMVTIPSSVLFHPKPHNLGILQSLVLMHVAFNTPVEIAQLIDACPALATLALFPARSSVS
ncbi:hypothetical protein H0H81_001916 [Sphagnurus paluster]|uniref:Uncharacterized protein n=1 Tax=Sphagnurus paluster TaxID=117069 RepID=A0A9P7FSQ8_9AGAR|nr:hypothetical protein H0H81_001916 [Sphagnurus paluster]